MGRLAIILCVAYIGANAAANLTLIALPLEWRGVGTVVIAAVLIGLDITARDKLHDVWGGDKWRLGLLIGAGALASALINLAALPIAVASCVAFALAGAVDTVAYAALHQKPWLTRVNGSNVASAIVDSAAFLSLAATLGVLPWSIVPVAFLGQCLAKILGGFIWSVVLRRRGL